jgi:hypothetical protein
MKRMSLAAFTLLLASSAQTATQQSVRYEEIKRADLRRGSLHPADHYVRHANNCGTLASRAVWGRHGALLGYACYRNSNGS